MAFTLLAGRASQICCGKLMEAVRVPEPGRRRCGRKGFGALFLCGHGFHQVSKSKERSESDIPSPTYCAGPSLRLVNARAGKYDSKLQLLSHSKLRPPRSRSTSYGVLVVFTRLYHQ